LFPGIEVVAQGTATGGACHLDQFDAEPVENACGRRIGIGRQRRLHATGQHNHPARVCSRP